MTTAALPSRVLLITGASRGIGAATARRAAQAGWDVAVNYARDADAAEAVVQEVRALGRRAIAVAADVAEESAVLGLFEQVQAGLGPIAVHQRHQGNSQLAD